MKMIGRWRNTWKCALCGEEHEGYGHNPAPLMDYNSALVCQECDRIVIAFRSLLLEMGVKDFYRTIDRGMYIKIKQYAKKHKNVKPYAEYLDNFFKNPLVNKITDPVNYGDLVEEDELVEQGEVVSVSWNDLLACIGA